MKPLVYTFRTNCHITELEEVFECVFVFNDLKNSFDDFIRLTEAHPHRQILGIGNTDNHSRLEAIAINKFGRGKLSTKGPETFSLLIPGYLADLFPVATASTSTFCNWTMYNISRFVNEDEVHPQVSFLHLNPRDLSKLKKIDWQERF